MERDIEDAIRTLLRTHMHLTQEGMPVIEMGAAPASFELERYRRAWLLLWKRYGGGNSA